jgi:anti-sigma factor ChrR (cupin superfamily)
VTHIGHCAVCRQSLATLEATGGALLNEPIPVPLAGDALDRLLARTDEPPPPIPHSDLPAPLNRISLGRWRTVGFGILSTQHRNVPSFQMLGVRDAVYRDGPLTHSGEHRRQKGAAG